MARGNIKVTTRVTKSSKKKSSTTPSSNTTKILTRSTGQPKDKNNNNNNDHNDNGEVGDNDEVILDDSETTIKLVIGQEFILSKFNSYEEIPDVGLIGIAGKAGTGEDEIIKLMRNQLFEPNTDADGLPLLKCALDLHRLLMNGSVSLHLKAIATAKYGSTEPNYLSVSSFKHQYKAINTVFAGHFNTKRSGKGKCSNRYCPSKAKKKLNKGNYVCVCCANIWEFGDCGKVCDKELCRRIHEIEWAIELWIRKYYDQKK